jgi:hypothetical protein
MADDLRTLLAALVESVDALPFECNWKGEPSGPLADFDDGPLERARAALAEGAGVGPSDAELDALWDDAASYFALYDVARDFARAVLARWGRPADAPRPIPVAERFPGAGDYLDEGWAWYFNPRVGWRQAVPPVSPSFTHWLPAAAIPLPEA